MTDKHTPGPWRVTPEGCIASEHDGYVPIITPFRREANRDQHGNATPQALANARLIAAAPEMLEALEDVMALVEKNGHLLPANKKWAIARDAIKEAKGDA